MNDLLVSFSYLGFSEASNWLIYVTVYYIIQITPTHSNSSIYYILYPNNLNYTHICSTSAAAYMQTKPTSWSNSIIIVNKQVHPYTFHFLSNKSNCQNSCQEIDKAVKNVILLKNTPIFNKILPNICPCRYHIHAYFKYTCRVFFAVRHTMSIIYTVYLYIIIVSRKSNHRPCFSLLYLAGGLSYLTWS